MNQKKFRFRFWGMVDKEEKYLTLEITPAQWEGTDCPNGYLFIQGGDFAIFINGRYEVVEKNSCPDWKDWFEIRVSDGGLLQVFSMRLRVFLNLPELIQEGANC